MRSIWFWITAAAPVALRATLADWLRLVMATIKAVIVIPIKAIETAASVRVKAASCGGAVGLCGWVVTPADKRSRRHAARYNFHNLECAFFSRRSGDLAARSGPLPPNLRID